MSDTGKRAFSVGQRTEAPSVVRAVWETAQVVRRTVDIEMGGLAFAVDDVYRIQRSQSIIISLLEPMDSGRRMDPRMQVAV